MTIRIRASVADSSRSVQAEGATLPHAVRVAARKLGLGPGRTVHRRQTTPGSWEWDWSGTRLHVDVSSPAVRTGTLRPGQLRLLILIVEAWRDFDPIQSGFDIDELLLTLKAQERWFKDAARR